MSKESCHNHALPASSAALFVNVQYVMRQCDSGLRCCARCSADVCTAAAEMTVGRGCAEEMIQPQDVAEAALLPFRMTSKACPSEIVIRNAADAGGT